MEDLKERTEEPAELGLTEEDFEVAKWDLAEIINSKEDVLAGIEVALEDNDLRFLLKLFDALSRSKNFEQITRELRLNDKDGPFFAIFTKFFKGAGKPLQVERA
ncbi:MAG: hypothetical protein FWE37_02735 [Spirochaetaceae bacterium]|nr:hypothetical protein [Spirochaetaceae bacterium]